MILLKVQTSGNRLVPDLHCIADVSEPLNPSWQFSVSFDLLSEGVHYPAERLHLVEADQLCWNPSGNTVLPARKSDKKGVCLSVCLFVKRVDRSVQIFIPYERSFSLVF